MIIPHYIKNGKILDIGCSYGWYLYQLKNKGWNVKGIELNKEAVEFAVKKLKLDVGNLSIENFQSSEQFDIIFLLNVLEHLKSPRDAFEKIESLLKPGGKLYISIPDYNGLEAKIYKNYV